MSGQYEYTPFPDDEHMRILILHPSSSYEEPIECDLEAVRFSDPGEYAALSYSWGMNKDGDASLNRLITVSGRRLGITQNLFEGLKRIRSSDIDVRIWIDAVCINQLDDDEKGPQVARMSEIYSNSIKTIVWQGEGESEHDDLATLNFFRFMTYDLTFVKGAHARMDHEHIRNSFPHYDWPSKEGKSEHTWTRGQGGTVDLVAAITWACSETTREESATVFWRSRKLRSDLYEIRRLLHALYGRRYFSRRWVCQELCHSPISSLEAKWGPCTFPLGLLMRWPSAHLLMQALAVLEEANFSSSTGGQYTEVRHLFDQTCRLQVQFNLILVAKAEAEEVKGSYRILTTALHLLNEMQCSDPRDILYALISLDPSSGLRPDYRLTAAEVYTAFAKELVENGLLHMIFSTLEELWEEPSSSQLGWIVPTEPLDGLPSWVPDLRHRFLDLYKHYPPLEATIDAHNVLRCMVKPIGVLGTGTGTAWRNLQFINHDSSSFSMEKDANRSPRPADGDLICQTHGSYDSAPPLVLVLRQQAQVEDLFTLVRVSHCTGWPEPSDTPVKIRIA